ncbi:MAG: penicillin-binding protein 2 [Epsilonproteobacteria bacterium]|nr:penicillin-binding protein 2 [Campylobacterota bacterium]
MRYKLILLLFIAVWSLLIIRLYHISIKSNYYYERLAKENIEKKIYLKPVRGEIIDSKGHFLAINKIGFAVSLAPHLLRDKKRFEEDIKVLKSYFPDLNVTILKKVYRKNSSPYNHQYIKVIDFVPYGRMMKIYPKLSLERDIKIEAETKRYYPYGKLTAHIVGYVGRSNKRENEKDEVVKVVGKVGKSGLEYYYNRVLEGELGYKISKVDAYNKEIALIEKKEPVSNRNLVIHLDLDLQKYIFDLLGDEAGVVIVMRTDGAILAAVSTPSFDPNLFVGGISVKDWKKLQNDLKHPFTNKLINALYPPGSTIKPGVALAVSAVNKSLLNETEFCRGYITIGNSRHKFRCWSRWGHGVVDLRKSIRESCDVYYYNKALKIGIDNLAKWLNKIGLGVKSGVDLPREYKGIIPTKEWKLRRYKIPWYKGETVIAAIGQGYDNVTPMQIARYTAFLATGILPTPHFAKEIDGKPYVSKSIKIDFDPYYFKIIREGMYDVCNVRKGTAYKTMSNLPIVVAGKTGTAQVVSIPQDVKKRAKEDEMEYFHRSHAWLTTYAPYDNPQYVVTVLIEHGGHGGSAAGPIAAKIYKWLYNHGYFKEHPVENNSTKKLEEGMEVIP